MKKLLIASVLLLTAVTVSAVTTEVFRLKIFEDYLAGEAKGVEIGGEGYISPGPALERQDLKLPSVWSCLAHSNGQLFVGAGNSGKIFMKEGKSYKEILDTGALAVTALVEGGDGGVYAATVPGGKIFRMSRDGTDGKVWVTLPDSYIWSLVVGKDGAIYAGTGPKGRLYAINVKGEFSAIIESKSDHIVRLVLDGNNSVLAGTAKGVLYRVEGKNAKVLMSFPKQEISALAISPKGEILIGLNTTSIRARPPQAMRPPEQEPKKDGEDADDDDQPGPDRPPQEGGQGGDRMRGNFAVFIFRPEGTLQMIMRAGGMFVTDMGVLSDGSVLIATGSSGRIIRLDKDNKLTLWADLEEPIVTCLALKNSRMALVGVANPGGVYEVSGGASQDASYTSMVMDARFISIWGRMNWKADGSVRVETRSGNVDHPDKTWSDWQEVRASGDLIASPSGRFIQFRINWGKSNAAVSDVSIAYRPSNQPPVLTGIQVKAPGKGNQAPGPGQGNQGDQPPQPQEQAGGTGYALVRWKAENPDGDTLTHQLEYRREGDSMWVTVASDLTQPHYRWDISGVPDGWYRLRVTVTDKSSNPPGIELTDNIVSEPFLIDNSRPEVRDLKIDRNSVVTGYAQDGFSRIAGITYSLDGGPAVTVWPEDGLLDQLKESFKIDLGKLKPGNHSIVVTAVDEGGNEGVAGMTFVVK